MKYFATIIFLISLFFLPRFFNASYVAEHPSLNETSAMTDLHLGNVKYYAKNKSLDRSAAHLQEGINMIKEIQKDIDEESSKMLGEMVVELAGILEKMNAGVIDNIEVNRVFESTLNTMAKAELRVSERYAESNDPEIAKVALKYAQMHLKSSFAFSNKSDYEVERHIFIEIDSLLKATPSSSVILVEKIDHMIEEIDELLASVSLSTN